MFNCPCDCPLSEIKLHLRKVAFSECKYLPTNRLGHLLELDRIITIEHYWW